MHPALRRPALGAVPNVNRFTREMRFCCQLDVIEFNAMPNGAISVSAATDSCLGSTIEPLVAFNLEIGIAAPW